MWQIMQAIWTNLHIIKGDAYRVGREGFFVKDGDLRVPLAKVGQQRKLGTHRPAHLNRL